LCEFAVEADGVDQEDENEKLLDSNTDHVYVEICEKSVNVNVQSRWSSYHAVSQLEIYPCLESLLLRRPERRRRYIVLMELAHG
jgi:hypothetical protein